MFACAARPRYLAKKGRRFLSLDGRDDFAMVAS